MTDGVKVTDFRGLAAAIVVAGFFLVSPIPHTAALRTLLLVALAGLVVAARAWKIRSTEQAVHPSFELLALSALTFYMFLQSLLWAEDRTASLTDFSEEWLAALLVGWVGYCLAREAASRTDLTGGNLVAWAVLALAVHPLWMLGHQLFLWVGTAGGPFGRTPYGNYAVLSTPINMAFALLLADAVARWAAGKRLFPWADRVAWVLLFLVSVAIVAVKARNGVITSCALLVVAGGLGFRSRFSRRQRLIAVAAVALCVVLGGASVTSDSRWSLLIESVTAAADTEKHKAWLEEDRHSLPALGASGEKADHSAYMRFAWAKIAVEGIVSHPFGYGYGLGGFGRYIEAEYGKTGFVSSHSGLLDFALANGIPGVLLLLVFVGALARRGLLAWASGNPWGLALLLTLTNYFVRVVLDGHFGSFRLKMVALLLGVLYWNAVMPREAKGPSPSAGT